MEKENKSWAEKFRPYYQTIIISLLVTGFGWIMFKVPDMINDLENKVENRAFTETEKRIDTERFMDNMTTRDSIDVYLDHVKDPGAHMPRRLKDSFYVRRHEFENTYKANAIDIYNLKKDMKAENEQQESRYVKLKTTLEIIEWKIDQLEK